MSEEELKQAFEAETLLSLYTCRIGRFIEGRVFVLHCPGAPNAFLLEAIDCRADRAQYRGIYKIRRSDPSLIIKLT